VAHFGNDIFAIADKDAVERLKTKYNEEEAKVCFFSIAHEGKADGSLEGIGKSQLTYFKDAIHKLYNRINNGIRCYLGHPKEGQPESSRTAVGEIVGKAMKTIGDVVHDVVAVYIYPEHRNSKLDVASIEANVRLRRDGKDVIVTDVGELTGVALASRSDETPGFPGAELLATMQAFKETKVMTLAEIMEAIRSGGHSPSDVFPDTEALMNDRKIVKAVQVAVAEALKDPTEKVTTLTKERDDAIASFAKISKETATLRSARFIDEALTELKADDKIKGFVNKRVDRIDLGDDITNEKSLRKAVDSGVKKLVEEYNDLATLFGAAGAGENKQAGNGAPGGDGTAGGGDANKPNPLIPGNQSK
jgi:hypothetical protein